MKNRPPEIVYKLSWMIASISAVTAFGGLVYPEIYRDNEFTKATWYGTDLTTIFVALPVLIFAIIHSQRKSLRGFLLLLGMLDYSLYNAGFYLFGAAFNNFYLLYAAQFSLSIYALIVVLLSMNPSHIYQKVSHVPAKFISVYMVFLALGLSTVYIIQSLSFVLTKELPAIITKTAHPTNVVFALDFAFVIPLFFIGAYLLWRHNPWGFIVSTIINIKGAVYMLGLSTATLISYQRGQLETLSELYLWGTIGISSLLVSWLLLRSIKSANNKHE